MSDDSWSWIVLCSSLMVVFFIGCFVGQYSDGSWKSIAVDCSDSLSYCSNSFSSCADDYIVVSDDLRSCRGLTFNSSILCPDGGVPVDAPCDCAKNTSSPCMLQCFTCEFDLLPVDCSNPVYNSTDSYWYCGVD